MNHIVAAFGKVSILDFERRIKKLISVENDDTITEKQLIEVFSDHPILY
jgi:hypothetical protein